MGGSDVGTERPRTHIVKYQNIRIPLYLRFHGEGTAGGFKFNSLLVACHQSECYQKRQFAKRNGKHWGTVTNVKLLLHPLCRRRVPPRVEEPLLKLPLKAGMFYIHSTSITSRYLRDHPRLKEPPKLLVNKMKRNFVACILRHHK